MCTHKKKYFKPYDEGYDIICLDCKRVIRKERGISKLNVELAHLIFQIAISSIALDIALETLGNLFENKKEKKAREGF